MVHKAMQGERAELVISECRLTVNVNFLQLQRNSG